jgi:hypothetical protein
MAKTRTQRRRMGHPARHHVKRKTTGLRRLREGATFLNF